MPGHVGDGPPQLDTLPEATWIGPLPDARRWSDPADAATRSESLRLAFIAALQRLPPRQRAALILRDVLAWCGPGQVCRNSRTIPLEANTQPGLAVYHPAGDGRWEPFAVHVRATPC